MWRPPTFSLKTTIQQLRLRYTTMWWSHTRANICDLDSAFKYGPVDGSFARLYFTSLNANGFMLFQTLVWHCQWPCYVSSGLSLFNWQNICTFKGVQGITSLSMKGYNHKGLLLIITDIHFLFEIPLHGESLLFLVLVHNLYDHYDVSVCVFVCVRNGGIEGR